MSTITIHYTCKGCGTTKKPLIVPERAIDGDPVEWAKDATRRARNDHKAWNEDCRQDWFDLYIPVAENEGMIGRRSE